MKRLLALFLLSTVSYADAEKSGKTCMNIPGRGPDVVKIIKTCKKGDVILLDGRHMPYLCDFDSAIINYGGNNRYACVFLGSKRQLREGSQY